MQPLTEDQVRSTLVNATGDERAHLAVPMSFVLADWDHLDFLAWQDPAAHGRGYIVIEQDGAAIGIVVRAASGARSHSAMCNICHTVQPGNQVALFTARRAGDAGSHGDSVGTYMCADLGCHENVRLAAPLAPSEIRASVDRRIDGTRRRVESFVGRVISAV
ncbi:FBP domain-containing protein [uncultured Microbacterium sp.]|uniref:FBP domain-containing protein n=1 Tax=uncultured Microbacterium sp. TaxID=191216 RepID=UPI00260DB347|nr:FBP domain-containing protein [uncultured Microbacterium sp.]